MCGRFSQVVKKSKIVAQLDLEKDAGDDETLQLFNIAPTHEAFIIADAEPRKLQKMEWGLVPAWSPDGANKAMLINARIETIEEKSAYCGPVRERRAVVVGDSFYEWRRDPSTGRKVPMRIFRRDGELLVFAAVWDVWPAKVPQKRTFSILTCPPNAEMSSVHDRMPVLFFDKKSYQTWLEKGWGDAQRTLLKTPEDGFLTMHRVSEKLGSVHENGPHLHEKVAENPTLF